jgi:Fe2+ or Zn2+ uptake regulation protein
VEFESEKIERIECEISHKLGFAIKSQRLQITADCEQMRRLGTCKNRSCD